MSGLLVLSTVAYLSLAVRLFKEDKIQLVYELNASTVKTLAAQTDALLRKSADKTRLLTQGQQSPEWAQAVFEADPDLISYALYEPVPGSDEWKISVTARSGDYLKLYGLPETAIEKVRAVLPIPFARVLSKKTLVWNSTLPEGAPILTLAMAIDIKGLEGTRVAVMDLRADRLLQLLSGRGIATVYIVDSEGRVVVHPDSSKVATHESMADLEIVRDAIESPVAFQLRRFAWQGKSWLAGYAAVGIGGLYVISQVDETSAFGAASRLINKSVLFAAIVVTVSLLLSGWVARGLTWPLQRLVEATDRVSRWDFAEPVEVTTRDEVGTLARSFNAMADALKTQRSQLDAHQAELEGKVKERTAALEQEKRRVSDAQDALLRTTRLASLGEIAGAAAHEILNPINNMSIRIERSRAQVEKVETSDLRLLKDIIAGWRAAYAKGGWDELQRELSRPATDGRSLVEEDLTNLESIAKDAASRLAERQGDGEFIEREIGRVAKLLNNMRALSRVQGERKPIDIHLPIEDTLATLSDLLEKKRVSLVTEFERDPAAVILADKDELVQVFSNLIRNSMQAVLETKRRVKEIKVTTHLNADRIEIRISDNGIGIPEENRAKIFEPSFTTKTVEEGTGLGLSISRRLVRAFNGDIELEASTVGEGTTFRIWFPVLKEA